jgi:hypothetical protein
MTAPLTIDFLVIRFEKDTQTYQMLLWRDEWRRSTGGSSTNESTLAGAPAQSPVARPGYASTATAPPWRTGLFT